MVNNNQRESDDEGPRRQKIIWERTRGGIWVQRLRHESGSSHRRKPRPECKCNIYGSPKRRPGDHHDEGCARRQPW